MESKVVLGYLPTRRSIFSAPSALEFRRLIAAHLKEIDINFEEIDDVNPEGLAFDDADVDTIVSKFRAAGISGLFIPHCNFGTEYVVARIAKKLNVPVLLWAPRDERPDANGVRLRDSQCGLFATGKVLRRFRVPFTYLSNCDLSDPQFDIGIKNFCAVCNVVRTFRSIRILQIGPRPFDFWSTMCNEGELLEKFNIQISPIPLTELTQAVNSAKEEKNEVQKVMDFCRSTMNIKINDKELENVAALKVAMMYLVKKYGCNAVAIQCWNSLQTELGIMPCAANSLLNEEGIPVACETDIHGAITSLLVEAAAMNEKRSFFSDWTVRHPDDDNGELLQHCGPWPASCFREKPTIGYPLAFSHPGAVEAEAKHGHITLARFDGDDGEYKLLLGNAEGIDGPYCKGTYLWIRVKNWIHLEHKIVTGPYIHHCVGIHQDVVPVLYEACKYIGITADLYDDNAEHMIDRFEGLD